MRSLNREVDNQLYKEIYRVVKNLKQSGMPISKILDVGCWDGMRTSEYGAVAGLEKDSIYGVDLFDNVLEEANTRITASKVNLETEGLPFEDGMFDIIICNQVFEHLKQIYRPMSDIWRMLSPNGVLIYSVPNLASFHNRVLLAFGRQPTSINVIGPHVRGFTTRSSVRFLELNGLFKVEKQVGVGFYPLPMKYAAPIGKLLRDLSHTVIYVARKQPVEGVPNWVDAVGEVSLQTNYD